MKRITLKPTLLPVILILLLVACDTNSGGQLVQPASSPSPSHIIHNTPTTAVIRAIRISIPESSGALLSGTLYGSGKSWVVCSHMNNTDQHIWDGLMDWLITQGYTVLTYDFPGFGESPGPQDIAHLDRDLQAALDYARQQGAARIALVGASMGGTATVKVAAKNPNSVAAIVVMSAPDDFQGLKVSDDELKALTMPKLFVNSQGDANYNTTIHMFDISPQPKDKQIYDGDDHGTHIFQADDAAIDRVVQFIKQNAPTP